MITDAIDTAWSTRRPEQQKLLDYFKQQARIGGVMDRFQDFTFADLAQAVAQQNATAKKADVASKAREQMKLIHAAALVRDLKYAVSGRKTMFALGAHAALFRTYAPARVSKLMGIS